MSSAELNILMVRRTSLLCLQVEHRCQGVDSPCRTGLRRSLARLPLEALTRVLRVRLLLIRLRPCLPVTLRGTGCLLSRGRPCILLVCVLLGILRCCTPGRLEVAMDPRITHQVTRIKASLAARPEATLEATRVKPIVGAAVIRLPRRPVIRRL